MYILKKNLSIIIVILLTLALISIVIWMFNKRIEKIDKHLKGRVMIKEKQADHAESSMTKLAILHFKKIKK